MVWSCPSFQYIPIFLTWSYEYLRFGRSGFARSAAIRFGEAHGRLREYAGVILLRLAEKPKIHIFGKKNKVIYLVWNSRNPKNNRMAMV